jgi:hypothetical protein
MVQKPTIVHVTHEAVGKIGGIGAVLDGLFTSKAYLDATSRNILVSPLFSTEGDVSSRLGPGAEVLYSSIDGYVKTSYVSSFRRIENKYNVGIVYGRRTFFDPLTQIKSMPEIILIDITRMDPAPLNEFKASLFFEYGIKSNMYENFWEFEQYMRLAIPAIAAIKAIGAAEKDSTTVIVSHEFMGMPTALAAKLDPFDFKTVFYAHEVAPVRRIVEGHTGHDTMFYNVMHKAHQQDLYVNDVFGDQTHYFKYALVDAARFCDNILAVGDCVVDELKFLAPEFEVADIDLTYNGIPAYEVTLAEKNQSREKLKEYCQTLLGWKPDFVFSHVTRLVLSKGLWRDLRVLEHMDREFIAQGKTGVLLVLSTETHRRRDRDIYNMETAYNWPVAHREGMPDLSGGEAAYYAGVQEFNARSRAIKVIFINQFGFTRQSCGHRMPYDMEFMDIRRGSDAEFGQSIYEPFGIAQLEPLCFGALCVVTSICGCAGFAKAVTGGKEVPNLVYVDYTELNGDAGLEIENMLKIDRDYRNRIEHKISEKIALEICARLPKNDDDAYRLLRSGYEIAKHMGWEAVAENYVLKSIHKAIKKTHNKMLHA